MLLYSLFGRLSLNPLPQDEVATIQIHGFQNISQICRPFLFRERSVFEDGDGIQDGGMIDDDYQDFTKGIIRLVEK